jgi:hypothetical protein
VGPLRLARGRAVVDLDSPDDPHPGLEAMTLAAVDAEIQAAIDKWANEPVDIPIKR